MLKAVSNSESIGGTVPGGVAGSVLFVNPASTLSQDNNNFYFQDSPTTPTVLATNTNVALSVNTNGDFSGTDAINIYGQMDAYLPNSLITNSVTGIATDGATPMFTASSSRGTGASPSSLLTGDMAGGFGMWGYGPTRGYYPNAAIMGFATGSTANDLGGEMRFYVKLDGGALTQRGAITNGGQWLINTNSAAGVAKLIVNPPLTIDTTASVFFASDSAVHKALTVQGSASQTANIFEVQASTGVLASGADSAGNVFASAGSKFYLYNTADQTTNYERLHIGTDIIANAFVFRTDSAGTGVSRPIIFTTHDSTNQLVNISTGSQVILSNYNQTTGSGGGRVILGGISAVNTGTTGTQFNTVIQDGFSPTATSTLVGIPLEILTTVNYSNATPGAGHYEALKIAVTETALPTGQNYLIRASAGAAGGTDVFSVFNNGQVNIAANNGIALTNQTSDSGAQIATMTNGPTAGNPAFWVRIQVNGVNLAMPAWTAV